MLLTTKAQYAVMAVVDLANFKEDEVVKVADVAKRQNISQSYLEKIFNHLKNREILTSVKGPSGGYRLARNAEEIFVYDIVKAVEEPIKFTRCSKKEPCFENQQKGIKCKTHFFWKGLERSVNSYLSEFSIKNLCEGNQL